MGRSSSKPLQKPNNPLQEMQYKELQRERTRLQQEKENKQIVRLQKKQAKRQRKTKAEARHTQPVSGNGPQSHMSFDLRRGNLNHQLETKIHTQLNEDLCEFLLNQMSLTIQFLRNYESEVSAIAEETLNTEKLFNHNLEDHSVLLTNPLDVAVSKWINYRPLHGPEKHNKQLLQAQTIYVVFENIDIARPNDANYDSISPLCKVDIEFDFRETTPWKENYIEILNNSKWKGYVRLRLREDSKKFKTIGGDFEDVYSEGSSGYGTTSPYSSRTALNIVHNNNGEQDYDYVFISHLNTQHPFQELKMAKILENDKIDGKVLPESCISSLGNFVQPFQDDEFTDDESENEDTDSCEDEECYRDHDTIEAIKLYRRELEKRQKLLRQNYLNSREFIKYFGELVRKKLAAKLNITEMELENATYRGTSIYTNRYELIPAIYAAQNVSDWPKCAFEFRLRERPISKNPQSGQQIQWPTRAMIKRIETFGFHVIPLGYAPKKKRNPFREIEWRIVFPKAERYLEQHLTRAQVKVYMITKALIKTFVEPLESNKALMLALDHLRMHLFWECEKDYTAWPEEFLGEVLLRFINSFKQRVKEKHLSDYFIRERNLFESIPEYSLNSLYTILADISGNPVMHLMIAFRNLEFRNDCFPKLNIKKLYENLTENEIVKLKMLAKNVRSLVNLVHVHEDESCLMTDEVTNGLVGLNQHHVRTTGKLRRKTHLLRHTIEIKKREIQSKRRSIESIDVEFFFNGNIKCSNSRQFNQGVENLRRTNILEILLDHLLQMVATAIQCGTIVMAKTYLYQARRLCKCYHNYGCDIGAKEYLASIHNLDEELQIIYEKEDFSIGPPSLPRRISTEPVLPQVPHHHLGTNSYNVYEEMIPQESKCASSSAVNKKSLKFADDKVIITERSDITPLSQLPEHRKSIKFHNMVCELQSGSIKSLHNVTKEESEIKTCLKSSSKTLHPVEKITSPEPRKSIKYQDTVGITLHQGDSSSIKQPQGYSPVSILKCKKEPKQKVDYNLEKGEHHNDNLEKHKINCENLSPGDKQSFVTSYLRNKLKTSTEFMASSGMGNSEVLQNLSHNSNKFLSHIKTEEKKAEIRDMLKRKTLQLKGVFNQSSDT